MGDDQKRKPAGERVDRRKGKPKDMPPAGPHARPDLIDDDKTPGTGILPKPDDDNIPPTG